jgi:hypothetical protein
MKRDETLVIIRWAASVTAAVRSDFIRFAVLLSYGRSITKAEIETIWDEMHPKA